MGGSGVLVRLVACVELVAILILGGSTARGQMIEEVLFEQNFVPGESEERLALFAHHATALPGVELFRLRGPVKSLDLRFEIRAMSDPDVSWQLEGHARFGFDERGILGAIEFVGTDDDEWPAYTISTRYEEIAGEQRLVRFTTGEAGADPIRWERTEEFEYDDRGRLIRRRLNRLGEDDVSTAFRYEDGRLIEAVQYWDVGEVTFRYDREGRLVEIDVPDDLPDDDEDMQFVWEGTDRVEWRMNEHLIGTARFDEHGNIVGSTYAFAPGAEFDREIEYDARGNWTEILVIVNNDEERRDYFRLTRTIEYHEN